MGLTAFVLSQELKGSWMLGCLSVQVVQFTAVTHESTANVTSVIVRQKMDRAQPM